MSGTDFGFGAIPGALENALALAWLLVEQVCLFSNIGLGFGAQALGSRRGCGVRVRGVRVVSERKV
eukprot:2114849-Rhodomonas_salina.1